MDKESRLIIADVVSLQSWHHQLRTTVRTRDLPVARFRLPGLSLEENDRLSALAERYRGAGGRSIGTRLALAMVPVLCLAYVGVGGTLTEIGYALPGIIAASLCAVAICGKILDMFWARWRLMRLARRAYRTLLSPPLRFSL